MRSADKPKNILIVQNDQVLVQTLTALLEEEGYSIIPAEDGLDGIKKAREVLPDLIICDVMLPLLNGFSLLAALRFTQITESIPIIFLTTKNDKADLAYTMLLGAVDYITKPFVSNDLIRTVKYHLKAPETQSIVQVDTNLIFCSPDEIVNEPTRNRKRLTFLEKVEHAIRLSRADSVEKKLFLNQPVSVGEIKERIKVLWKKYDENPSGSEGLIAVWLETRLQ
jgi:DNA-binding response OmpR family regulator